MSRKLEDLNPEFRVKVESVLEKCSNEGITMRPFFTLRSPFEQAKLWRQSRTGYQIRDKIETLRMKGANFLADCLLVVGPQQGKWATNAISGLSWHQHGFAIDCFWVVDGRAEWSQTKRINGKNGYQVYADIAESYGLTAGHFWNHRDSVHIQYHKDPSPLNFFNHDYKKINDLMEEKFSHEMKLYQK